MNGVATDASVRESASSATEHLPLTRYEVRAATVADSEGLYGLADHLDTVNLPADPDAIRRILQRSEESFSGQIANPCDREYVFVLADRETGKLVGTSMVIGQLGRRGSPYVYLEVGRDERYSATLDRHFDHRVLRVGYGYDGPTELGGLVVHPGRRRSGLGLGRAIAYLRFLFIAARRECFRAQLLAELLPPLESDGTSHLWEALGRRFTGLSYSEADRISKHNKEFIRALFPEGEIHASLLSDRARAVIGQVGPNTRGVERMLRAAGFRYAERVDPFDGGPHFVAETDHVRPVVNSRQVTELLPVLPQADDTRIPPQRGLLVRLLPGPPYLSGLYTEASVVRSDGLRVDPAVLTHFRSPEDGNLWWLPLDS